VTTDRKGNRHYHLIDADTHVNEPPDLWSSRLPDKFRLRAPRMEQFEEGDAWVLEGVKDPINFGLNAAAGMPVGSRRQWVRWDEIRAGGYDPKARLAEMDEDQIDAAVLYPTPRLSHSLFANPDAEFHLALIQSYNDWLAEYCAEAPDRLGGITLLPNRGIDQALAEVERMGNQGGMVGMLLGCYPHGDLEIQPEDDPLWGALADAGIPLHIHVSLNDQMPGAHTARVPGDLRIFDISARVLQFIWTGVLDRFPSLQLGLIEVDCGWIPYLKEQVDDRYRRLRLWETLDLPEMPSTYIERNMFFTYITDHYGIRNRHDIGVERILWSSDFPHLPGNFPNSWPTILADFSGVPTTERELILAGNAKRLYGFGTEKGDAK
jgi:predicted TIM-barrel fold metal-dependent hydrolase